LAGHVENSNVDCDDDNVENEHACPVLINDQAIGDDCVVGDKV
jgi:hypothetical protein